MSDFERVHELQLMHDALQSSVASLKALVEKERVQTRTTKRKLAVAEEKLRTDEGVKDEMREKIKAHEEEVQVLKGETETLKVQVERAEEAQEMVEEMPHLKKRVRELEELVSGVEGEDDLQVKDEKMKRKLMELKIARRVIVEKDKILKEMKGSLKQVEEREIEEREKVEALEKRVKELEEMGKEAEELVRGMGQELKTRGDEGRENAVQMEERVRNAEKRAEELQLKVEEVTTEREILEKSLEEAKQHESFESTKSELLKEMEQKEKELEDMKNEFTDYQEVSEKQLRMAEDRQNASSQEVERLQEALGNAEKEVQRLTTLMRKRGSENDIISPPGGDLVSFVSECESIEKAADLEAFSSSAEDNVSTVALSNKAILPTQRAIEEKQAQLGQAVARANLLEKDIKMMRSELHGKVKECAALEMRILDDLEPNLREGNEKLRETERELKAVQEHFDQYKADSERSRKGLEEDEKGLRNRLRDTLELLQKTQEKCTQSEVQVVELERRVVELEEERGRNTEHIDELVKDADHRKGALLALQTKLSEMEERTVGYMQDVEEAVESQQRMKRMLEQANEKTGVAESRSQRMELRAIELEEKLDELQQNHMDVKESFEEKSKKVQSLETEVGTLKEIVQIKEEGLKELTETAKVKQERFEVVNADLRAVIEECEENLRVAGYELDTTRGRVQSLGEALSEATERIEEVEGELQDKVRELRDEKARADKAGLDLEEARQSYTRLRGFYESTREELELRERQVEINVTVIAEKESEISGLKGERDELGKRLTVLRGELRGEREVRVKLEDSVAELERALNEAKKEITRCEEELGTREAEVESLNRRLVSMEGDVERLEGLAATREEQLEGRKKEIAKLEVSLERSKHQLEVLERHFDGYESLLTECRKKEEELLVTGRELAQAKEYICQVDNKVRELDEKLAEEAQEQHSLNIEVRVLEKEKEVMKEKFEKECEAREQAEVSLNSVSMDLTRLEKTSANEIGDLKVTLGSLRKMLDERGSVLSHTIEKLSQASEQAKVTEQQLMASQTRSDYLFAQLTAAEYQLSLKKESDAHAESKHQTKLPSAADDEMKGHHIEAEHRTLSNGSICSDKTMALEMKHKTQQKAISSLQNWCRFINEKLYAAEKALSDREMDLECSSTAFRKVERQLQNLNNAVAEKESQLKKVEALRLAEKSALQSRIGVLQAQLRSQSTEAGRIDENPNRSVSSEALHVSASDEATN